MPVLQALVLTLADLLLLITVVLSRFKASSMEFRTEHGDNNNKLLKNATCKMVIIFIYILLKPIGRT